MSPDRYSRQCLTSGYRQHDIMSSFKKSSVRNEPWGDNRKSIGCIRNTRYQLVLFGYIAAIADVLNPFVSIKSLSQHG